MSYDIDFFKREKKRIIKKCSSIKSNKKQIEYLIKERIDYQQKLVEEGEPSIYCDTFADTATPQGGGDDLLIQWLFNETERRRIAMPKSKEKQEYNITKLEDILPDELYPRKVIAIFERADLSTIENWIRDGVISDSGERIYLIDTPIKNERRIKGQDYLDFRNKRYSIKE